MVSISWPGAEDTRNGETALILFADEFAVPNIGSLGSAEQVIASALLLSFSTCSDVRRSAFEIRGTTFPNSDKSFIRSQSACRVSRPRQQRLQLQLLPPSYHLK
jgi:hypothetical protein